MLSLVKLLYDAVDKRIVRILKGSYETGVFTFPDLRVEQRREYFVKEYFKHQPSLARQAILMAYLRIRNTLVSVLKKIYRAVK